MDDLLQLQRNARQIVKEVEDNPEGRYKLRYDFYQRYGHPYIKGCEGLGNSELAFLKWEIKRGVLNPLSDKKPGSEWWRSVNTHFLYSSTLAELIYESGEIFKGLPASVEFWLKYINTSNGVSWYKAHNCSIIEGYNAANSLAIKETKYEQAFMNIVLYRLLYAQSMVEGISFGWLGKIFANPRGLAVSIITDIDTFYPKCYPLSKEEINCVMHRAHNLPGVLEDIFDEILILPELGKLYSEAAKWNTSRSLLKYTLHNIPVYPLKEKESISSLI